jgi:hypothetical protein
MVAPLHRNKKAATLADRNVPSRSVVVEPEGNSSGSRAAFRSPERLLVSPFLPERAQELSSAIASAM